MSELYALNPRYTRQALDNPWPDTPDVGIWSGTGAAIAGGVESIYREAWGAGYEWVVKPALEATELFNQEWLDQKQKQYRWELKTAQPDANVTGIAGNILGGFLNIGGEAIVGAIAGKGIGAVVAPSTLQAYKEKVMLEDRGVDPNTSTLAALAKFGTTAAAVGLPVAVRGIGLFGNFGVGAIGNTVAGAADRYATHEILERDYPQMAEHYKWNDANAATVDLILGGLMGLGTGRFMQWQAERAAKGVEPSGKPVDTATEDAARVMDGALQRDQGIGLYTKAEDAIAAREAYNAVQDQLFGEGRPIDQLVIPDAARKIEPLPDPSIDVLHNITKEILSTEAVARAETIAIDAARKAADEQVKAQFEKPPEAAKPEEAPAPVPESADAFLSNEIKQMADANPDATFMTAEGPKKLTEIMRDFADKMQEAQNLGRLHKIAAACAIAQGDAA